MTIETEMSLNADGNTAVTVCLWQQLADCSMRVMLLHVLHVYLPIRQRSHSKTLIS